MKDYTKEKSKPHEQNYLTYHVKAIPLIH